MNAYFLYSLFRNLGKRLYTRGLIEINSLKNKPDRRKKKQKIASFK